MALDKDENILFTGITYSNDYPVTNTAVDTSYNTMDDAFLTKIKSDGTDILYSTYIGGSQWDNGNAVAVDSNGDAYVAGYTQSSDFPTTAGAYDTTFNGGYGNEDCFITKVRPTQWTYIDNTYWEFLE